MKKILSILFFTSLILLSVDNLKSSKAYALASCPNNIGINISRVVPVTFSAYFDFIIAGPELSNISRINVSWGDGSTNIYSVVNKRVTTGHPYNQVGDFPTYVEMGDGNNWLYFCNGPTIAVYSVYQGGFGSVTLRDPGSPNSVSFNANTQFGGDNIIGYYTLGQLTYSGVGGSYPIDTALLTIDQWGMYQHAGADTNTADSNPNYVSSDSSELPASASYFPSNLSQRSNLITLRLTRPANSRINDVIVSIPASSAIVNLLGGGQVYWRPRNVSQLPTPTPLTNSTVTPTATTTPTVSGWTFPSRVFDQANNQPVTDIVLKLYGSNDGVNKIGPLATCSKANWDSEKCRPTLFTTSFYKWYFVKKEANPTGFSSVKASCASPAIVYPTTNYNCQVIDANTVKWGGKYGYHEGTKGFYSWSDFVVKKQ